MIKSCVIGLSKIGLIHCDTLIKLKNTQLTYVYDFNSKLSTKYAKQFKCNTTKNFLCYQIIILWIEVHYELLEV